MKVSLKQTGGQYSGDTLSPTVCTAMLTAHPQLASSWVTVEALLHHMQMARDTSITQAGAFSTSGTCLIACNLDYAVLHRVVTNAELILGGVPEVDDPILQTGKSQGKVGQCIMGHQEPQ